MTIWILNQEAFVKAELVLWHDRYVGGDEIAVSGAQFPGKRVNVWRDEGGLPVDQIVRPGIPWTRTAIPRREVFQKLDSQSRRSMHAGDAKVRTEDLVEVLLLSAKIFALADLVKTEKVAIKSKARVCARDGDRGVIYSKEKLVPFPLPARIAFAWREANHFEVVLIRIAKIERPNARCAQVPIGQPLWIGGYKLNFECAQFIECHVHVAHHDCDVLKPQIIAPRVFGNRLSPRCEIFRKCWVIEGRLHFISEKS